MILSSHTIFAIEKLTEKLQAELHFLQQIQFWFQRPPSIFSCFFTPVFNLSVHLILRSLLAIE